MSIERAYKALDYDLKLYGFQPLDLCGVAVAFTLLHGSLDSLLADILALGPLAYLAWRGRRRPPACLRSLFLFASTPGRFPVGLCRERFR